MVTEMKIEDFEVLGDDCEISGYREYLVHKETRLRVRHFRGKTVEESFCLFQKEQVEGRQLYRHP
jgi:hypothetical protein